MKKYIQFYLDEDTFNQTKASLSRAGMTWQSAAEGMVEMILSEEMDQFGIPLVEMALTKNGFETKIQEKFIGSMREYAFICLAKKNNKTKRVEHKETEVERLLLELEDVFDYAIKGKWDKQKAAVRAVEFYDGKLSNFVTKANNMFERYYGEKANVKITADDLIPHVYNILEIIKLAK